jgi:dynein heavy chain
MNREIEEDLRSLTFLQVPASWHAMAYPSLKPLMSWFNDFVNRLDFFRDWCESGFPSCYWIGSFFFPQGFVTALLQTHSRAHKVPVDSLGVVAQPSVHFDHLEAPLELLNTGAYIYGLAMEGAAWDVDRKCLREQRPQEVLCSMPIVALIPCTSQERETPLHSYTCPVYKVSSRAGSLTTTGLSSNFIIALGLNGGDTEETVWIQRSCALISSSSE